MTKTLNRRTFLAATAALPCVTLPCLPSLPDNGKPQLDLRRPALPHDSGEPEILSAINETMENICCNFRNIVATTYTSIHVSPISFFAFPHEYYLTAMDIFIPSPFDTSPSREFHLISPGAHIPLMSVYECGWCCDSRKRDPLWKVRLQRHLAESMFDPKWFVDGGTHGRIVRKAVALAAIQEAARIGATC